jgi:hypothetical protein
MPPFRQNLATFYRVPISASYAMMIGFSFRIGQNSARWTHLIARKSVGDTSIPAREAFAFVLPPWQHLACGCEATSRRVSDQGIEMPTQYRIFYKCFYSTSLCHYSLCSVNLTGLRQIAEYCELQQLISQHLSCPMSTCSEPPMTHHTLKPGMTIRHDEKRKTAPHPSTVVRANSHYRFLSNGIAPSSEPLFQINFLGSFVNSTASRNSTTHCIPRKAAK